MITALSVLSPLEVSELRMYLICWELNAVERATLGAVLDGPAAVTREERQILLAMAAKLGHRPARLIKLLASTGPSS